MKRKLALLAGSIGACVLLTEIALRIFATDLSFRQDERCLMYRHDSTLGWFPTSNTSNRFTATRTITVVNNSDGFRGPAFVEDNRPRVLFIGDSFVWGYDAEANERFTELLQTKHPECQILNCGVSGYGTDQEFLLLQRIYDRYKPSAVLLVFCSDTDHDDNSTNMRPGGYFKPYFDGAFHGLPVPQSERGFLSEHTIVGAPYLVRLGARAFYQARNGPEKSLPDSSAVLIWEMQKFLNQKATKFAVGVQGPHAPMLSFLKVVGVPYIDLTMENIPPLRYQSFGCHWTPEGHRIVSERIASELPGILAGQKPPALMPADEALKVLYEGLTGWFEEYGRMDRVISAYREIILLEPTRPEPLNNLAWILATAEDPKLRNGQEAISLAAKACALTSNGVPRMVGTLAAAYAERGKFDEAVRTAAAARDIARGLHEEDVAAENDRLIGVYRQKERYRK